MDRTLISSLLALALLVPAAAVPLGARGDERGADGLGAEWTPIDPARLDDMRGGFQLPSGATLSFGIERVVYVNGELAASTAVRVADLSRLSAEEARALGEFNNGM